VKAVRKEKKAVLLIDLGLRNVYSSRCPFISALAVSSGKCNDCNVMVGMESVSSSVCLSRLF